MLKTTIKIRFDFILHSTNEQRLPVNLPETFQFSKKLLITDTCQKPASLTDRIHQNILIFIC